MTNLPQQTAFEDFLETRFLASDAYVVGDLGPLTAISVAEDPASIFPPHGVVVHGAAAVEEFNRAGVASFGSGSTNDIEVLHAGSSGDLGYVVGIQRSTVVVVGQPEPVPMELRLTELFRREDGRWLLFHRHADRMG